MESTALTGKSTPKTKVKYFLLIFNLDFPKLLPNSTQIPFKDVFIGIFVFSGRVSVKVSTKNRNKSLDREARRLQALQIRKNKRDEAMDKKRKLGGLSEKSAPFLTCFVTLHEEIDVNSALAIIESCDEEAFVDKSNPGITYLR